MTADPDLVEALRRVRSLTGTKEPDATLLRRLALQGAEATVVDQEEHHKNVAELRTAISNGLFELTVEEIDALNYPGFPPFHGR